MRVLPLGAVRVLPLGMGWLGQDDGDDDFSDYGAIDPTDNLDINPIVTPGVTIPDLTAPDISSSPYTSGALSSPGFVGPVEPGEDVQLAAGTQLNADILSGVTPPPAGGALTSQQAQTLNAAGATPDQVGQILGGQTTYAAVLSSLTGAIGAATNATKLLSSSATGLRPSPVTCPTAPAGYSYTLNAANQCILAQGSSLSAALTSASVIAGVPNWMLLALAAAAALAISQSK
jgi:hypothetical protein